MRRDATSGILGGTYGKEIRFMEMRARDTCICNVETPEEMTRIARKMPRPI